MIPVTRQIHNLYEINTATYLDRLSRQHGQTITLATIPDEELDRIASYGMDAIWLMGIWRRSPIAIDIALHDEPFLAAIRATLPDFTPGDMIGSAYAISAYQVNDLFGGEAALKVFRSRLAKRSMRLILDFVPNHTAFDHEWLPTHKDYYIHGTMMNTWRHRAWYRNCDGLLIAKGRDPQFEPWSDVAQLNAFSSAYRQASIQTLSYIAALCDGVRCDMAMLMLTDIFAKTWGKRAGTRPTKEYWNEVIVAVRQVSENFTFIAECYWEKQADLLHQGFDYCYDKDTYDFLVKKDFVGAEARMDQVEAIAEYLVHFLENHDEPRAAAVFDIHNHQRALQFTRSLPGMHLWHDGEFEGYTIKLPVHLLRGPAESTDPSIEQLYRSEFTP